MPLYEYFCRPCGAQFEVLRSMSEMDEPARCPAGHTTNNRVLSLFALPRGAAEGEWTGEATSAGGCACGGACSCGGH